MFGVVHRLKFQGEDLSGFGEKNLGEGPWGCKNFCGRVHLLGFYIFISFLSTSFLKIL